MPRMTDSRLAEIRELYDDAKAHGCFISINDTGELLAEIDALRRENARLEKARLDAKDIMVGSIQRMLREFETVSRNALNMLKWFNENVEGETNG